MKVADIWKSSETFTMEMKFIKPWKKLKLKKYGLITLGAHTTGCNFPLPCQSVYVFFILLLKGSFFSEH